MYIDISNWMCMQLNEKFSVWHWKLKHIIVLEKIFVSILVMTEVL